MIVIGFFFRLPASAASLRGGAYTDNKALAAKLTNVLQGKAVLFRNTDETFAVGDSIDPDRVYTWGGEYPVWGYQCLAYAQAVYYYLFSEIPGDASGAFRASRVALRARDALSYQSMLKAGVGCGAYVRTTGNSDYSFNGSDGHSFIVLTYDEEGITILEGNADYNGLIAVNRFTWRQFNAGRLTRQGRKICFILQPDLTAGTVKASSADLPGDADQSGEVDSGDARLALRAAVGLDSFDARSEVYRLLDVDGDGALSSADARLILRAAVDLEVL